MAAVFFGAFGCGYALLRDISWLSPLMGGLIGVVTGGLLGWGGSIGYRDNPTRRSKVIYGVVCVVGFGVLMAMKTG